MWNCKQCRVSFRQESPEEHIYENHVKPQLGPLKLFECGYCLHSVDGFEGLISHFSLFPDHPTSAIGVGPDFISVYPMKMLDALNTTVLERLKTATSHRRSQSSAATNPRRFLGMVPEEEERPPAAALGAYNRSRSRNMMEPLKRPSDIVWSTASAPTQSSIPASSINNAPYICPPPSSSSSASTINNNSSYHPNIQMETTVSSLTRKRLVSEPPPVESEPLVRASEEEEDKRDDLGSAGWRKKSKVSEEIVRNLNKLIKFEADDDPKLTRGVNNNNDTNGTVAVGSRIGLAGRVLTPSTLGIDLSEPAANGDNDPSFDDEESQYHRNQRPILSLTLLQQTKEERQQVKLEPDEENDSHSKCTLTEIRQFLTDPDSIPRSQRKRISGASKQYHLNGGKLMYNRKGQPIPAVESREDQLSIVRYVHQRLDTLSPAEVLAGHEASADIAHRALEETRKLISTAYHWKRMSIDIKDHVRACVPCRKHRVRAAPII